MVSLQYLFAHVTSQRDLERQVAAAKHSSVLVRAEISKEQRLLEEATAELEDLEKNARAEQKARIQRERGVSLGSLVRCKTYSL